MNELPPLELKQDRTLGRHVVVPLDDADDVAAAFHEADIPFQLDPEPASPAGTPGQVTFRFGRMNVATVRDALLDWGFGVQVDPLVTLAEDSYRPPLEQLLRLGETKSKDFTTDYVALGFTAEHVPELIRMMSDEELHTAAGDNLAVWAPIHAWRALGGLSAEPAIGPMLALLSRIDDDEDDWVGEEVPEVLGAFGPAALEPVTAYLADAAHGLWARAAAARTLAKMGELHPPLRAGCVASLVAQLERSADQSEMLNAYLISHLLDLRAVEALPFMERAFASGRIDEAVNGDLEDAEIALGVKTQRLHPRKPNLLTKLGAMLRESVGPLPDGEGLLDEPWETGPGVPFIAAPKVGRNDPCPCGSGKKSKKCCG